MIEAQGMAVRFRLDTLLKKLGMSQSELSRRSGISFVTINAVTNNKTKQVSLETLDKLCEVLGVTPGRLLYRESPHASGSSAKPKPRVGG